MRKRNKIWKGELVCVALSFINCCLLFVLTNRHANVYISIRPTHIDAAIEQNAVRVIIGGQGLRKRKRNSSQKFLRKSL